MSKKLVKRNGKLVLTEAKSLKDVQNILPDILLDLFDQIDAAVGEELDDIFGPSFKGEVPNAKKLEAEFKKSFKKAEQILMEVVEGHLESYDY